VSEVRDCAGKPDMLAASVVTTSTSRAGRGMSLNERNNSWSMDDRKEKILEPPPEAAAALAVAVVVALPPVALIGWTGGKVVLVSMVMEVWVMLIVAWTGCCSERGGVTVRGVAKIGPL
jgi:hypothetical protein